MEQLTTSERHLRILLVDDEEIVHQTIGDYLRQTGHHVDGAHDADSGLAMLAAGKCDLALVDIRLPGMSGLTLLEKIQTISPDLPVIMISGHGTMDTVIEVLRRGATDYLKKPIKLRELDAVLEKAIRLGALQRRHRHLAETIEDLQSADPHPAFVGESEETQRIRESIQRAVEAECATVLLTGETGTGKEVVAHEIHRLAASSSSPLISVCCPALPETLAESELFGHVKGAFTGAIGARAGHFELAEGGTLFLDEVADLSLALQAKLLRVIETRALRRVGGTRETRLNVRVIAASNAMLEDLIESGGFRRDLFYRLNVHRIHLLPLRERPDDILPLAKHFLEACRVRRSIPAAKFSSEAEGILLGHNYPGNVRELRNVVERAATLCRAVDIEPEHLSFAATSRRAEADPHAETLDGEAARIRKALEETHWNRRQAAQVLGIPYSTLRYKMTKHGIS